MQPRAAPPGGNFNMFGNPAGSMDWVCGDATGEPSSCISAVLVGEQVAGVQRGDWGWLLSKPEPSLFISGIM
jgi:hypothetical protein